MYYIVLLVFNIGVNVFDYLDSELNDNNKQ